MKLSRPPLLLSGLILGLFGLANLLSAYHSFFFHFFNGLALLLWLYLTAAFLLFRQSYWLDLQKPPLCSSFATYPMASMLLASYLSKLGWVRISQLLWYAALLLHLWLIVFFTWRYLVRAKQWSVTPSWTVLYVGLAMVGLTNGVVQQPMLGCLSIVFGLLTSLLLYPLIFCTLRKTGLPDALKPQWAIYCAPFSLLLGSCIRLAGADAKGWFVVLLLFLSQAFYLLVLFLLPKIFRLGFQPSCSALTFPLVNTAFSLKLGIDFLQWKSLVWLSHLEAALACAVLVFVCWGYIGLLFLEKDGTSF
ncbi:TDT family transporter [Streptococcus panodentis]|uniref:Ethanolamine utilization protein EutJ n=1 Tax=Streptococcus panodentis TaxID=1581472 RepID=A0ABS5AXS7_9STRE|nr:ethanolamine utilization protein EutJ [Streptococcus panodentis]